MHLFADEAGNFDFRDRVGASNYFILGTVTLTDTAVGDRLLQLRRDLAWQGVGLESCFHASEDKQVVRDAVIRLLAEADFRADFTILEKRKTVPYRQNDEGLYKLAWFRHMMWISRRIVKAEDELLVVAASIGTRKRRRAIRLSIEDVINQTTLAPWEVAFWPAESDPCLQVADYVTWAVQRKWETGDCRSYDLISHKISTEYDYFKSGSTYYY
ncbi:hypothetical protein acdb102_15830 [Acidothermaceae bacterium B102]|nr:hypothetical protein acdb102_15830 [Acidothermaceae bacterium B102]